MMDRLSDHKEPGKVCGTSDWAALAADRICNLDGIRPHLRDHTGGCGGDAGMVRHMTGTLARIIQAEYDRSDEVSHASGSTPGPWRVDTVGVPSVHGRTADETPHAIGPLVCVMGLPAGPAPNAEANAPLIAAAPELLQSLREVMAIAERTALRRGPTEDSAEQWDRARALVKRLVPEQEGGAE